LSNLTAAEVDRECIQAGGVFCCGVASWASFPDALRQGSLSQVTPGANRFFPMM
jgi:hypothetical protein